MHREKVARLRNELGWETAWTMERLWIESMEVAWLDYFLAQLKFAQVNAASKATRDHYEKRLDRAHNRFLTSIKTRATVGKMAQPTLIALQGDILTNRLLLF